MRKPGLLFLLLILIVSPVSAGETHIAISTDLAEFDSFFSSGKRISIEPGVRYGQVGLTFPLTYGFSRDEELALADLAISLRLYPIEEFGLYFATDVASWIHIFGADAPEEKDIFPTAFSVGYTFQHGLLLVEPELVFQNPLLAEGTVLSYLSERFYSYMDFYLALKVGLDFTI